MKERTNEGTRSERNEVEKWSRNVLFSFSSLFPSSPLQTLQWTFKHISSLSSSSLSLPHSLHFFSILVLISIWLFFPFRRYFIPFFVWLHSIPLLVLGCKSQVADDHIVTVFRSRSPSNTWDVVMFMNEDRRSFIPFPPDFYLSLVLLSVPFAHISHPDHLFSLSLPLPFSYIVVPVLILWSVLCPWSISPSEPKPGWSWCTRAKHETLSVP